MSDVHGVPSSAALLSSCRLLSMASFRVAPSHIWSASFPSEAWSICCFAEMVALEIEQLSYPQPDSSFFGLYSQDKVRTD